MAMRPTDPRDKAARAPIDLGGGGDRGGFSGFGMGQQNFGMPTGERALGGAHKQHEPDDKKKKKKKGDKHSAAGDAAKFVFMPEIGRSFQGIKFAWDMLVNMVAQIYVMVKLIPANHPCTDLRNASKYKLSDIIRIAFNDLKWQREDIPRIVIFFAVLAFIFFVALTIVTLLLNLGVNAAHAQPAGNSANAANDVLNQIFNLQNGGMIPTGFGAMLKAYSNIILILAGLILLWTIVTTVVESMREGKPFGKGFNGTWAPVRLVFALGLLIPLSSGLNSGQYITLYLAKWGSDLASGVFGQFTNAIGGGSGITVNDVNVETQKPLAQLFDLYLNAYVANDKMPGSVEIPTAPVRVMENGRPTDYVEFNFKPGPNAQSLNSQNGLGKVIFFRKDNPDGAVQELANKQGEFFSQNVGEISRMARDVANRFDPKNSSYFNEINKDAFNVALRGLAERYGNAMKDEFSLAVGRENEFLKRQMQEDMDGLGWVGAPIWYQKLGNLNAEMQKAYQGVPTVIVNGSSMSEDLMGQSLKESTPDKDGNWFAWIGSKIAGVFAGPWAGAGHTGNMGAHIYKTFVIDTPNPYTGMITLGHLVMLAAQTAIAGWTMISIALGLSATEVMAATFGVKLEVGMAIVEALTPLVTGFIGLLFVNGYMLSILFPLIPVIRFVFGVLGWVAMVLIGVMGMPLFALAHLKTGGEGWVGQLQVASAYNMLIGIIVRPTLIMIGFILGLVTFNLIIKIAAHILVAALDANTISNGAMGVANASPFNFTTQILTLFLFSSFAVAMANACFKFVDIVPSQAMTWMGTGPMSSPTEDGMGEITSSTQSFAGQLSQFQQSKLQHDAKRGVETAGAARQSQAEIRAKQRGGGGGNDIGADGAGSTPALSATGQDGGGGLSASASDNAKQITSADTGNRGGGDMSGGESGWQGDGTFKSASGLLTQGAAARAQAAKENPSSMGGASSAKTAAGESSGGGEDGNQTSAEQGGGQQGAGSSGGQASQIGGDVGGKQDDQPTAGAATSSPTGNPGASKDPGMASNGKPAPKPGYVTNEKGKTRRDWDKEQSYNEGYKNPRPKWQQALLGLVTMGAYTRVEQQMAINHNRNVVAKSQGGQRGNSPGAQGGGGGSRTQANLSDPNDPNGRFDPNHPNYMK